MEKSASRVRCTKYQQYYNGYEIESSLITTFDMSDTINVVTGQVISGLNVDTSNPISYSVALNQALNAITDTFLWQDSILLESFCRDDDGFFDSVCYSRFMPKGKLCIDRKFGEEFTSNNMRFVWKFVVNTISSEYRVLVNAQNGDIYDIADIIYEGQYANGNVQTLYDGYVSNEIETFKCTFCTRWTLKNSHGNKTLLNGDKVKNRYNEWTNSSEAPATTAHWIIGQLADFYRVKYNNNVISKDTYLNAGIYENNAYYNHNSNLITLGRLNNKWLSAIDIVGHELGHRLVCLGANLEYFGESGALNESFADIFGTLSERYIRSNHDGIWNWTIGEDAVTIRSMSNPLQFHQPNNYGGLYWVDPNDYMNDHGGVHTNSGVQNKWFYNLSQMIGPDKAGLIAYYMVQLYLTPTSRYNDALFASVFAAENLFGRCSDERMAAISAWHSVGVSSNTIPMCSSSQQENYRLDICDNTINMLIYPNPASEIINIELSDEFEDCTIEIYNALGVRIAEILFQNKILPINVEHLSDGLYLIKAKINGRYVAAQKILINQ